MHQNNASGCTQSSAPQAEPSSNSRQGNATVPQTHSERVLKSEHQWELEKSSIDRSLINLNFRSVEGDEVYEILLELSELDRRNDGRLRDKDLKRYESVAQGGWVFRTVEVSSGELNCFSQIKPDNPYQYDDNGKLKTLKYESPKGSKASEVVLAPQISLEVWQLIGETAQVNPSNPIDFKNESITAQYYRWLKDNPSIPLIVTEGIKKVCCFLSLGYASIGLVGHTMGTIKDNDAKTRYLNPQLEILIRERDKVILAFDVDEKPETRKLVKLSQGQIAGCIKAISPETEVTRLYWKPEQGKGFDDVVGLQGEDFVRSLFNKQKTVQPIDPSYGFKSDSDERASKPFDPSDYGLPRWFQSDVAEWITQKHKDKLAWNVDIGEFYRYESVNEGIWSIDKIEFINRLISKEIKWILHRYQEILESQGKPSAKFGGFNNSFLNGVRDLIKYDLSVKDWNPDNDLIPFKNGVLKLSTKEFKPHSPDYKVTWSLPYEYNPLADCDPIKEWMKDQLGDWVSVELIRAYFHGILTGRVDWQKYLELIGPGGTGKGTLLRLAIALVGKENVHTTTLKKLEESRFETASIKDKKLVLITDSERYAGGCSVLKALTGQDTLPYEKKGKQSTEGFIPNAMVLLAANEHIQSSDYTSGLSRRRVTVGMNRQIDPNEMRDLITLKRDGSIEGEFADLIPGLVNWVLGMNPQEATDLIRNHSILNRSLAKSSIESLLESNPLSAWADICLVLRSDTSTYVGTASKPSEQYLYASYFNYCRENGNTPLNNARFSKLLHDLLVNQLKLKVKRHKNKNGSYFVGIAIRDELDWDNLLISQDYFESDRDESDLQKEMTVELPMDERGDGDEGQNLSLEKREEEKNQDQIPDPISLEEKSPVEEAKSLKKAGVKRQEAEGQLNDYQQKSGNLLIKSPPVSCPLPSGASASVKSVTNALKVGTIVSSIFGKI